MDKKTNEIRAQKWAEVVIACNQSGQAKKAWCEEHGINRKSFYYWQNKLREQAAGMVPATNSIVPLRIAGPENSELRNGEMEQARTPSASQSVRIEIKGVKIVLPSESSPEYVASLAKALVSG